MANNTTNVIEFSGNKISQTPFNEDNRFSGGDDGGDMEGRIAKLESSVEYIQRDIAEIKADIKDVEKGIGGLNDSISSAKVWALLLYIGLAGGLLYILAHGFKWLP